MIFFIQILLNLSLGFSQSNEALQVQKNGQQILLLSKECSNLIKQATALSAWKSKQKSLPLETKCSCDESTCKLDVSAFLPQLVVEKQGTCSAHDGPNCWNNSLVSTGILPHLRYTTPEEMNFWMTSPLCQERKPDESPAPGDIIAIRDESGGEVHGFINLTGDLAYSKNGYAQGTRYELQSPKKVFDVYDVPVECQRFYQKPPQGVKCDNYANYFKCDSIDDFLNKNPISDQELKDTWLTVNNYECENSDLAFSPNLSPPFMSLMKTSVTAIQKMALDKGKLTKIDPNEKFLWKGIEIKTTAMLKQLELLTSY